MCKGNRSQRMYVLNTSSFIYLFSSCFLYSSIHLTDIDLGNLGRNLFRAWTNTFTNLCTEFWNLIVLIFEKWKVESYIAIFCEYAAQFELFWNVNLYKISCKIRPFLNEKSLCGLPYMYKTIILWKYWWLIVKSSCQIQRYI